jgi:hypothetical protein
VSLAGSEDAFKSGSTSAARTAVGPANPKDSTSARVVEADELVKLTQSPTATDCVPIVTW